jgi:VCBS repeat-containing protein
MAESPSSNQTIAEAGNGAVAGPLNGTLQDLVVVVTEDGVPVIDLREALAQDGALVVVDGELMLRLADGTEWPVDVTVAAGDVVLQVAEQGFVAASSVQAALQNSGTVLPLANLAEAAAQASGPASETVAEAAEPAADAEGPVHGGGAGFRAFEILDLGPGLDPLLALGPTSLGASNAAGPFDLLADQDGLGDSRFGVGSRHVNFAPIAGDDVATTNEREAITIDVLANDRDPNPNDTIRIVSVQAEGLLGSVSLNADGTIAYDPNGAFGHLGKGETATETFTYTIADERGETDTGTVTVEITGINDAPLAEDDLARTTEDRPVAIDVLANDVDPDANDALEVVGVDATGLFGNLVFLGDGQFGYDPAGRFDFLGEGQTATETFRYAVADPHGEIDIATVQILIEGVNDAPVAANDVAHTNERSRTQINVLNNDFDPDQTDSIRVVGVDTRGLTGHAWINPMGGITYDPAGKFTHLAVGEYATETLSYTVADQHGATSTAEVTVYIWGKNDAPVAKDDKVHTNEKSPVEINVIANDYDPDRSDAFGVVAVDATGLQGELAYLGNGKFAYDPNGQFDHLGKGQTATETFQYALADEHGAIDIATAKIVVHGVNDAPVAETDVFRGFANIGFYAPIEALLGNDYDIDQGDTIHFAGLGGAVNGEVTVTPDGYVVFIPDAGFTGLAGFQYAIEDQHGAFDIGNVFVDITPIQPGDVSFEVLALYGALNEAEVTEQADGSITVDMVFDIGAVAGASMLLGDMPFFTAILSGEMQGVMQVTLNPDGSVQADGDVIGDLDLELIESPIFQPLGGDFFDALFGPSPNALAGGLPTTLHAAGPNSALADILVGELQSIGLLGLPAEAFGGATAASNAVSFGDGTFFLEIGGLLNGGATLFDDVTGDPEFLAELFGEFAAVAGISIRDAVEVAADGLLDSSFDTSSAPLAFAASGSTDIGDLVIQDQAVAA